MLIIDLDFRKTWIIVGGFPNPAEVVSFEKSPPLTPLEKSRRVDSRATVCTLCALTATAMMVASSAQKWALHWDPLRYSGVVAEAWYDMAPIGWGAEEAPPWRCVCF